MFNVSHILICCFYLHYHVTGYSMPVHVLAQRIADICQVTTHRYGTSHYDSKTTPQLTSQHTTSHHITPRHTTSHHTILCNLHDTTPHVIVVCLQPILNITPLTQPKFCILFCAYIMNFNPFHSIYPRCTLS